MRNSFFLQVPNGLENIAKKEINSKFPELTELKVVTGGLELECEYIKGVSLNYHLKIPNRILLRLESFTCRDFPKLYQKISKITWNKYLSSKNFKVQVSIHKSRLLHSGRVAETVTEAIEKSFKACEPSKKWLDKTPTDLPFMVHIRIDNDQLQLSMDTSGERLGVRGYKTLVNHAPLRENLAAACIYALKNICKEELLIVDPFCGSGTFLLEYAYFNCANKSRPYAFEFFPGLNQPGLPKSNEPDMRELLGLDISPRFLDITNENAKGLNIKTKQMNVMESAKLETPCLLIGNPPWGERIEQIAPINKIIHKLKENYNMRYFGLLMTESMSKTIKDKPVERLEFESGGKKVKFFIFENKQQSE